MWVSTNVYNVHVPNVCRHLTPLSVQLSCDIKHHSSSQRHRNSNDFFDNTINPQVTFLAIWVSVWVDRSMVQVQLQSICLCSNSNLNQLKCTQFPLWFTAQYFLVLQLELIQQLQDEIIFCLIRPLLWQVTAGTSLAGTNRTSGRSISHQTLFLQLQKLNFHSNLQNLRNNSCMNRFVSQIQMFWGEHFIQIM